MPVRRTFTIRLPHTVPGDRPPPLILVLHGNNPDGDGGKLMREWTTFNAQADTWGVAVAYPDGHGGCWADGRGVTTADEAGVDDVAFLRVVIDRSADHYGTDREAVTVAGVSNGAFMAHRLALEASDRIAVLAAVAGTLPVALADRRPTHAVSALLIHGTADPLASIEGGYSRHRGPGGELRGRTLSLHETADRWRTLDRCAPGPTHTTEVFSRTTSEAGVGGTRVTAWTVIGGGHTWPSTHDFDAAEEICRFAEPLRVPTKDRQI